MSTRMSMTVTVNDRAADARLWGTPGVRGPVLRTVQIGVFCPECGMLRGRPERHTFFEDGYSYSVDCWVNPCGHDDLYTDVLAEAKALQEGAAA